MPDLLILIEERLRPRAIRAGFALVCGDAREADEGLRLLEYRRRLPGQPPELLDVSLSPDVDAVIAHLWSPSGLALVSAGPSTREPAIRSGTWRVDPADDPVRLASEIAVAV